MWNCRRYSQYTKEHLEFRVKVSVLYTAGLKTYSRTMSTMSTVASCWFDVKKKTAWTHTEELVMPTCAKLLLLKHIKWLTDKDAEDADVLQKISDQIGLIKVKIVDYISLLQWMWMRAGKIWEQRRQTQIRGGRFCVRDRVAQGEVNDNYVTS